MRPGRMRNGASWSAARRGALVSVGWRGGTRAGCSWPADAVAPAEERSARHPVAGFLAPARSRRWRSGLSIRPVLKHGPRSLTCTRAGGWQTHGGASNLTGGIPLAGCTIDRP